MTVYTPNTTDGGREMDRAENRGADERDRTMGEVSHTNPYTDESFGDSQVYNRGRVVVVDGGEADTADEEETIGDVDHTPREDAPSTHEVYERGGEGDQEEAAGDDGADADTAGDVPEVGEE